MGGQMRFVVRSLVAALLASFLTTGKAEAGWPDEYRLYEENDFFNLISPFAEQTDRYYTQGIRLEFLWYGRKADETLLPTITHADWCRILCGKDAFNASGELGAEVADGFAAGQNMYTPEDITIAAPQPDDRPWGGWLYASRIARVRYADYTLRTQRQDLIEISLGMVGPASLAGATQIWWHDVIDDDRPAGWDNQLRNEPVLQLRYETALRWPQEGGDNADIIARARAHLGNALTSLEADVTGRLGFNVSGFGVSTIPGPPPPAAFARAAQPDSRNGSNGRPSGNAFVRGGIKAIAHNIFLDGNTFASNDIRIKRKILVPEIAAGLEVNPVSNVWMTLQFIRRGSEFETSTGRDSPAQNFGALTLAWAPRQ